MATFLITYRQQVKLSNRKYKIPLGKVSDESHPEKQLIKFLWRKVKTEPFDNYK